MKKTPLLATAFFCSSIISYAQPVTLDSSFADNGLVKTGGTSFYCTAVQNDGKIIVAGTRIARYNTDGSLDKTFSEDGTVQISDSISSIIIQKDCKIVVAGSAIARYNTDGTPDITFSGDGKQITN